MCRDSPLPPLVVTPPSQIPLREMRGPVAPPTCHTGAIMDLKTVDVPVRLLLSCSRDETVKVWR